MISAFLRYLFLFFFISCPFACGGPSPIMPSEEGYKPAFAEHRERFVSLLRDRSGEIASFRALSDISYTSGFISKTLKQVTVFERPDKFRMELFQGGLHALLFQFISRDGVSRYFTSDEKVVYRLDSEYLSFGDLLDMPLRIEELMLWMVGLFPPPELLSKDCSFMGKTPGYRDEVLRYLLSCELPDGRSFKAFYGATLWRDGGPNFRLDFLELCGRGSSGCIQSDYYYPETYNNAQSFPVPGRIRTFSKGEDEELDITYRSARLGVDLSPKRELLFNMRIPRGYREVGKR